jgi:hypothetical protein
MKNIVQLAEHKIHALNLFQEWRTIVTNNNAPLHQNNATMVCKFAMSENGKNNIYSRKSGQLR